MHPSDPDLKSASPRGARSVSETQPKSTEQQDLRERLKDLEDAHRATLNMLEDFDEEKRKLQQFQQATMNLLEDAETERLRLRQIQSAMVNLLEDFDQERARFRQVQAATINLLEDAETERQRFRQVQSATLNLLEDAESERQRFGHTQTATLNLLEDFHDEQTRAGQAQAALMNILEDIEGEHAQTEKARALLEAVNKELEAFSYSVSHDLRAPLRAISGFSQALTEDCAPQLNDEGRRYLALIQDNAHKMGRLIDDLLAFSRMGRQQMMETELDMAGLARSVFAELSQVQPPERRIEFEAGAVPPARGDKAMIHQVFMNLLSNAIKFTRNRPAARIEFGCLTQSAETAYYVRDNGVGFDMQYANKLFGVFQRLHSLAEFEGTGVGLALVSRIVTRHRGRVWAESKVNEGATFYFTLSTETPK